MAWELDALHMALARKVAAYEDLEDRLNPWPLRVVIRRLVVASLVRSRKLPHARLACPMPRFVSAVVRPVVVHIRPHHKRRVRVGVPLMRAAHIAAIPEEIEVGRAAAAADPAIMPLLPKGALVALARLWRRLIEVLLRYAEAVGLVELETIFVSRVHENRIDWAAVARRPLDVEWLTAVGFHMRVEVRLARARVVRARARATPRPDHPVVSVCWLWQLAARGEAEQRARRALADARRAATAGAPTNHPQRAGKQQHRSERRDGPTRKGAVVSRVDELIAFVLLSCFVAFASVHVEGLARSARRPERRHVGAACVARLGGVNRVVGLISRGGDEAAACRDRTCACIRARRRIVEQASTCGSGGLRHRAAAECSDLRGGALARGLEPRRLGCRVRRRILNRRIVGTLHHHRRRGIAVVERTSVGRRLTARAQADVGLIVIGWHLVTRQRRLGAARRGIVAVPAVAVSEAAHARCA